MSVPAVSVVMPVYNAAPYLAAAIDSVLSQTFHDLELIAVDDGSTDGSLQILRGYQRADPRVRVLAQPNGGIVSALNAGINVASAEIVARMDADDLCLPTRLERQVSFLDQHSAVVAVGCIALLVDRENMPIMTMFDLLAHDEIDAANLRGETAICHPAAMMRRSTVSGAGGYRKEFQAAEDIDLFLRLAEVGKLANLDEVLLRYRLHPTSIGHAQSGVQRSRMIAAVQSARARRRLPPLDLKALPAEAPLAEAALHRKWAWWALRGGHVATARKHAVRAARIAPLAPENLRLLACAARGR